MGDYPGGAPTSALPDTKPEDGPPGSDLELLREQTLDFWEADYGILNCAYWVQTVHNEYLAAALELPRLTIGRLNIGLIRSRACVPH